MKCPLVMIEWEDSSQPISKWQHLSSFEPTGIIVCMSVGWLISDKKKYKAIAPNMGAINDVDNLQVSGVIHIPTKCIRSITKIKNV